MTGAVLAISGGVWEVSSHTMGIVDTLFTVPHLALHGGIVVPACEPVWPRVKKDPATATVGSGLFTGLRVQLQMVAGTVGSLVAQHAQFDPDLFTPVA